MSDKKRALILSGGGARGAYQAGVWNYLQQIGWQPDLICGTSVGAINACAIGSGIQPSELSDFWYGISNKKVYRYSLWTRIWRLIRRSSNYSLFDTSPLRKFLEQNLDLEQIKAVETDITICAVNIENSQPEFFNNTDITVDHVMASSAMPIIFPWVKVDDTAYWDGGVMANTPILPALQQAYDEIVVVLLSPLGKSKMRPPRNRREAAEVILEQCQISSYQNFMVNLTAEKELQEKLRGQGIAGYIENLFRKKMAYGNSTIYTIAPDNMLGFRSLINFNQKQTGELITSGFNDAKEQLAGLLEVE